MSCVTMSIVLMDIAIPLAAQTDRATLTGVVTDPSRSVVPGAQVELQAAATGTPREMQFEACPRSRPEE